MCPGQTEPSGTINSTYDANDRLLTAGPVSFQYNANGSLTRRIEGAQSTDYAYDGAERLARVDGGGHVSVFMYDALGNQIATAVDGATTRYLVDANRDHSQVLEERNAAGDPVVRYVHGDDLISQQRAAGSSFYLFDGTGSTRILADAAAAATDTYTYDAFGNLLARTGTTENSHLYTGERFDPNLGFYYLRARYYSPETGRFISMDPFEGRSYDPPTLHKYVYAANNPVDNIDPSGKWTVAGVFLVVALILLLAELLFFCVLPSIFAHKDNVYLDFSEMHITGYNEAAIKSRTIAMVTADFAAYKVTVTTSQPASSYKHVQIGGDSWWFGDDTFGWTYWNTAYVYTDYMVAYGTSIGAPEADVANAIGNTTSHEIGHSFGLGHEDTHYIMQQGWKTDDRTWSPDAQKKLEKLLGLK